MSRETFPGPMNVTSSTLSSGGRGGRDGCCVYQCTMEIAGTQYWEGEMEGWDFGTVQPVANNKCV